MPTYQHIEVLPLTPSIGAEVRGVDLAAAGAAALSEIRRAFLEHLVLVFRDQRLDRDELKALGRAFGPLHVHPGKAFLGLPGDPEIFEITAEATSRHANGEKWHSDLSCESEPPLGSMLYLNELPDCGGDTLFCNMYAVYDSLSEPLQRFLCGLEAMHDGRRDLANYGIELQPEQRYPNSTHPVVVRHPETHRPALFVNPSFTVRIEELEPPESDALLALLHRQVEAQPRFHCRIRWAPDTLVFWDNRCAQHHAVWDYFPATRRGERVTIAGKPLRAWGDPARGG